LPAQDARAGTLDDLWYTPDQQGARAYAEGDFGAAAEHFENPAWKAGAQYRAGQYGEAARTYGNVSTADDAYNLGNALAYSGQLEQALGAYDQALEQAPGDKDARFNRDLVASLLKQQNQQQQDQDQQNQTQQGDGQQQSSSGSGQGQDQNQNQEGSKSTGQEPSGNSGKQPGQDDNSTAQSSGHETAGQSGSRDSDSQQTQADSKEQTQTEPGESGPQEPVDNANRDPAAGKASEDQSQVGNEKNLAQNGTAAEHADGRSAFQKVMDQLLQGNGSGQDSPQQAADEQNAGEQNEQAANGMSELDQAREQQLRAVPDDPSGLLRARIRQYYSRAYPNSQ
ncbi:MAG: tetratricopeptide repeat protein, partial [Lysobacterales bacterium]